MPGGYGYQAYNSNNQASYPQYSPVFSSTPGPTPQIPIKQQRVNSDFPEIAGKRSEIVGNINDSLKMLPSQLTPNRLDNPYLINRGRRDIPADPQRRGNDKLPRELSMDSP